MSIYREGNDVDELTSKRTAESRSGTSDFVGDFFLIGLESFFTCHDEGNDENEGIKDDGR